jgi:DNA-binding PadR family transcriptional regulator
MSEAPPADLILAAIERAQLHHGTGRPGVLFRHIVEHLGLTPGAWITRQVRPAVERLAADGLTESSRSKGHVYWALTASGRKRLGRVRRTGRLPALPESPQHRHWREGRETAVGQIAALREDLRHKLETAMAKLDADQDAKSDEIIADGAQLREAYWRLGAATYCLREWAEPNDGRADSEDYVRRGRRNLGAWAS